MKNKAYLNKDGWYPARGCLKRDAPGENGKNMVTIQKSVIRKQDTGVGGLKYIYSETYGLDVYLLDKSIGSDKIQGVFDSKRDALKYFDIALISRGRDPKYILKKA